MVMKHQQCKKFMVALDGSDWSQKSIAYLCRFSASPDIKIDLVHVFSDVPECYHDLKLTPSSHNRLTAIQAWENAYKRGISDYMEQAKSMLLSSGVPESDVSIKIEKRKRGIARDILDMAKNGYDALVVAKKGTSALQETALGSITVKLVEMARFLPLIITDQKPLTGTVLLAVDGSPGSDRAVSFAAEVLGKYPIKFVIGSVLRGYDASFGLPPEETSQAFSSTVMEELEGHMVLGDASTLLKKAGIPETAITHELIRGAKSRAEALSRLAAKHNCDTVILGRKGWSDVDEFAIGRVAWKCLHTAKFTSIWIIP